MDSITELTATIAENTAKVNAYLQANQIPKLSFDVDVPAHVQSDPEYAAPRDAAMRACSDLQALLGGSSRSIFTTNTNDLINLQAVCRFNIATSFPASWPTATYAELSEATKLPEPDVRRIVRGALTNHVFQEKEEGKVSHTAASRFLANFQPARQWVEMYAEEILPAAAKMVNAMEKWPGSGDPSHVGYALANDTDKHCFDHMAQHPRRLERFSGAMTLFSHGPGYGPEALLEHFSTENLTDGKVVDVGGSHGAFSMPLVRQFPKLRVIIQDQPDVIATGHIPEDIKDRVEFMAHDFFQTQLVKGDVYLLRWVLHDWSDEYCVKILRALIPAMQRGTRVIIHEWIVPEPHQSSPQQQASMRMFDLYMKSLCNGKEREERDWKSLVREADERFMIRCIKQTKASKLGIIDVEWAETRKHTY